MASLLSLPGELRNMIYVHLFVFNWFIDPFLSNRWTAAGFGLLCANKAINREASSILYSKNLFNLAENMPLHILRFLSRIGRRNAAHIQYMCISFPFVDDTRDFQIDDGSAVILSRINRACPKLKKLTLGVHSELSMDNWFESCLSPEETIRGLSIINTRLRIFRSLQEIIVEVFEGHQSYDVTDEMKNLGWILNMVEAPEGWSLDDDVSVFESEMEEAEVTDHDNDSGSHDDPDDDLLVLI